MDRSPIETAGREARRELRLGRDASCLLCGVRDLETLREVRKGSTLFSSIRKILLEEHHICGRANDPDWKCILCRNCHARASESQLREKVPLKLQENVLDRKIARRKALACFHRDAARAEDREAEELEDFADFLDSDNPGWRARWKKRK